MSNLSWVTKACGVCLLWAMAAVSLPAQTFITLYRFDGPDGSYPAAGLVQGTNGKLYGTTAFGGADDIGTVFSITASGTLTTLHSFDGTDGEYPYAGLVQGTDGNFYGTTSEGGANSNSYCYNGFSGDSCGTIFKITPNGTLTTLYSFCSQSNCTDGFSPGAGLVQRTDGNLYGTTVKGGANSPYDGTVFKITTSGTLTTLHSFDGTDGDNPIGGLVQAPDGNFYGTTANGGTKENGDGTVFKITPSGALTTLHNFDGTDGTYSTAVLVHASDGNFYGTTYYGGVNNSCEAGCGTVFKITPGGALTSLYSFCAQSDCTDGFGPMGGLMQATDGNLYGTTQLGGANDSGTLFEITPGGTLTTLHTFCSQGGSNCTDGENPIASLIQDTNGTLYGTASDGGFNGNGTLFGLSVGLGPFVETNPTSGKVGAAVKILGSSLTGATSVTFNGTAAVFTVKSSSEITTTVPTGAATGTVQVVTPTSGTLSSNVPFTVRP